MRPLTHRPTVWTPQPTLRRGSLLDRIERRRTVGMIAPGPVATVSYRDVVGVVQVPARRRRVKHSNLKKLLVTSIIVASLGTLASGTFASFTAQTGNPSNALQTGTLILGANQTTFPPPAAPGVNDCLSNGGGVVTAANSNTCAVLVSTSTMKPGDTTAPAKIALTDRGSVNFSLLYLYIPSCTDADDAETYHGTGSVCTNLSMEVQEYTDSTFTVARYCWYGTYSSAGVSPNIKTTCTGFSGLSAFQAAHNTSANALDISTDTFGNVGQVHPLNAGVANTRYFQVTLKLASAADNTVQGRKATFDLDWYGTQ